MEKRKPRESIVDELALAKSSAWAWFEHRSSRPEDGPTPESMVVSRTKMKPKQSRFKVEAMRKVQQTSNSIARTNSNCSLLDGYEIERISRKLDYYMESSRANHHGGGGGGRIVKAAAVEEIKSKYGQKKVSKLGFWFGSHFMMCGSSMNEMVDRTSIERPRRRSESAHMAVVDVGRRPRQGIHA